MIWFMYKNAFIFLSFFLFCSFSYADTGSTDIYCTLTKKHLYTYTGDLEELATSTDEDLIFVEAKSIVVKMHSGNDELVCPFDGSYLNGYLYWFASRGYSLPRMAYHAVTVMTLVDGEFVWRPYELNLVDD